MADDLLKWYKASVNNARVYSLNFATYIFLFTINCVFIALNIRIRNQILIHTFPDFDDQTQAICEKSYIDSIQLKILVTQDVESIPLFAQRRNVEIVKKNSFRGMYYSKNSKWIFFTHGIYWTRLKRKQQVTINLWHGIPFKKVGCEIGVRLQNTDFLISSSKGMSDIFERMYSHKRRPQTLPFGLPRNDQFSIGKSTTEIAPLKNILWLPTYRKSVLGEIREDGNSEETNLGMTMIELRNLDTQFYNLGLAVFLKAHPASRIKLPADLASITTEYNFQPNFYSQFHEFDALITDYSSVAADFALTGKPIFLFGLDSDLYRKDRGFFITPQEALGVPMNSSVEELVKTIGAKENSVVSESKLRFIHANYQGSAIESIWEYLSIEIDDNIKSWRQTSSLKILGKVQRKVMKILSYGISALTNSLPLIFALFSLPAKESAKVFLYVSIYTLVQGLSRILFGDYFLVMSGHIRNFKIFILKILLLSIALFAFLAWIAKLNFNTSIIFVTTLIIFSGIGILQDVLRYVAFSQYSYVKIILSDSLWLLTILVIYLTLFASEINVRAIHLLIGFAAGATGGLLGLRSLWGSFPEKRSKDSYAVRTLSSVIYLAGIALVGPVANFCINLILTLKGQDTLLADLRGLQIFLLPVGFLVGFQQIAWLPELKLKAGSRRVDIFSWSALTIIVPIIYLILKITGIDSRYSNLFVLMIFLESLLAFAIAQIGYKARAYMNYSNYFASRACWLFLVLFFVYLTASNGSPEILAIGLVSSSLISLIITSLINRNILDLSARLSEH